MIMCIDMMTFTGIGFDSDDLLGGASLLRLFMTKSKTLKRKPSRKKTAEKQGPPGSRRSSLVFLFRLASLGSTKVRAHVYDFLTVTCFTILLLTGNV
jgi:hypothetical protein